MQRNAFIALTAGFVASANVRVRAATRRLEAARRYFGAFRRRGDFSGIVAMRRGTDLDVLIDGTIFPGGPPLSRDSRFVIGSISKHMTAVGLLLLEEAGRLQLADPLARFLPSYPRAADMTLRQLATHRAGLGRDVPLPTTDSSVGGWLDASSKIERRGEPNVTFAYSNIGYVLLAAVIERASDQPFGAFLRERVFTPLGMSATNEWSVDARTELTDGGIPGLGATVLREPIRPGSLTPGAGSIVSSIDDMLRWDVALANGAGVLSAELRRRLTTPVQGYALGLGVGTKGGRRVIGHDGEKVGFVARFDRFPDDDAAYVLLCNVETGALDAWRDAMFAAVFDEPMPEPHPAPLGLPFDRASSEAFAGLYNVFPGFDMDIALQPGGLVLRGTGGDVASGLTPIGDRAFFFRLKYSTLTFAPPVDGRSPSLTWHDTGGDYLCKRVS
jgi:D-alanyl-D-alanine carboxypeptidase